MNNTTKKNLVFKKRLLKLADFLWNLPDPKRFRFSHWVGDTWEGKSDLSCGTSACAFGFSTTIPSFRKLGLRLVKNNKGTYVCLVKDQHLAMLDAIGKAAKTIFDLDADEWRFIFLPRSSLNISYDGEDKKLSNKFGRFNLDDDASAADVAANIRYFVNHKYK